MAAFLDAIGLISGVLGIVQFGMDNLASSDSSGAVVRVHAGRGENSDQSMGGSIHQIYGFDNYNNLLGASDTDSGVDDGGFADIMIHQDGADTVNAKYVNLINGDDATCVVYTSVTQPDGVQNTWLGDVGYLCGQVYYESGYTVGTDGNGNNVQPKCTWIDGNGDPTSTVSMKIDTEFYHVNDAAISGDQSGNICGGTIFSDSSEPIPDQPAKRSFTRSIKKRSAAMASTLVVNHYEGSSAAELCAHENSYGWDIVSVKEGTFCDMENKQLYPLCSDAVTSDCFDLDAGTVNLARRAGDRLFTRDPSTFNYTRINEWK